MPRPGFVLDVDRSTPPSLVWRGDGFTLEKLPTGSRIVYPPEPSCPGMKLTIAFDDTSLPLPPMEQPDNRQRVIEAVLDLAAQAGVDDVVLIVALALHRRMTDDELRHALGDRIFDAFAPHGLLLQHDAEDPDALIHLGQTDQ